MKKYWISLLCICCMALLGSCHQKKQLKKPTSTEFEALSGQDLPAWDFIQTKEDLQQMSLFKGIYDLRRGLLAANETQPRIPKAVHFIWIGPKQFPRESVQNVRTWMANNPDWTFYFWTDRPRPTPVPGMQTRMIQGLNFLKLRDCFKKSDNYAEKSDLLRYEILFQEGGVYVDHDVKCFKSFDDLNAAYDFYCGMDMPGTSSLPTCVHTTNNLIGAVPGHPILKSSMEKLAEQWDQLEEAYPGSDRDSVLNRVLHRTFWLFCESVKQMNNQGEYRDIVFPAYYFDAPKEELAIYARHQYAGSWHETESAFEKMVRQRLMILSKKTNKILLLIGVVSAVQCLALGGLFFYTRRSFQRR